MRDCGSGIGASICGRGGIGRRRAATGPMKSGSVISRSKSLRSQTMTSRWSNRPHGRSIRLPSVIRSHRLLGGGEFTTYLRGQNHAIAREYPNARHRGEHLHVWDTTAVGKRTASAYAERACMSVYCLYYWV